MSDRARQMELALPGWGGRRDGAGRPRTPGRGSSVRHRSRPKHNPAHPVHVTMRARRGIPNMRSINLSAVVRAAIAKASRPRFRVTHFSVQVDHLHAIVEATDDRSLARGISGLAIRSARAINRRLRRTGRVWGDRYHARALTSPREVRSGILYVLQNWKRHVAGAHGMDELSSGPWFGGWSGSPPLRGDASPVAPSKTWLGTVGWLRAGGPLRGSEAPAAVAPLRKGAPRRFHPRLSGAGTPPPLTASGEGGSAAAAHRGGRGTLSGSRI
jgi:REP element-mobilizing transposase RayT